MTMGTVKPKGKSATETRRVTPKHNMAKWGGQLQRLGEKPKGKAGPGKGR